jgi:O-antigen ligase
MILFYLLVSVMPLARHPLWSAFVGDLTLIKYLGAASLVYAVARLPVRPTALSPLQTWQARWFVCLAVLGMVSFVTKGPDVELAISPLMNYLSFLLLLFVTVVLVDSSQVLRWTLLTAAGSVAYASLHSIREWQKYGGFAAGYRPGWITGDPNYFSVSAVLILPVIFYLIRPGQARWERLFCYFSLAVTLFATTLAASRGALMAIVASTLLTVIRSRQRARMLLLSLVVLLPLLLIAPSSPLNRILSPTSTDYESTESRILTWDVGLSMIRDFPLAGIGAGNFKPLVRLYADIDKPTIAHNTYIGLAAETGLPGLLLFLAIFAATFRSLSRVRRLTSDQANLLFRASLGIEVSLVGYLVAIFFISAEYQKLFWLLVFLSGALEPLARAHATPREASHRAAWQPLTA